MVKDSDDAFPLVCFDIRATSLPSLSWATAVMMPVPSVAFVRRRNFPAVAKGFVTEQHLRVAPVMPVVSSLAIAART